MSARAIDCFLIGHNEIGIARYNQLIRLIYGKTSKNYSETAKYNLSHIRCEDGHYSPSQIFNLVVEGNAQKTEIADTFSLTIAYLASFLHRWGLSFGYVNTFHREADQARLSFHLGRGDVRCVAITTTYYLNVVPILDIIKFVRSRDRDVPIIVGGPFIHNQVELLGEDRAKQVFEALGADFYVDSSEGELTLAHLVGAIKLGLPYDGVHNLYYRTGRGYAATPKVQESNELDANPVEWGLFRDDIRDVVNIRTSKSCPFRCSFCSFPGAAGKYKVMDLAVVKRELDALHAINQHLGLDIIDDTFNIPRKRFAELLRLMIRKRYQFKWYAFYKAQLAEREITRLMKEAGCVQVFLGCESGSQLILDNLQKDSKVTRYHEAFEYLHEQELLSIASFIVGFPGETDETYRETFEFIERTRPTFFRTRLWWYDRTAPVHRQRERFQLTGDGYEWRHYTMDSTRAQQLADEMILGVKGSIHATDYPIPFEMISKGVPPETAEAFMARFRDYLHLALVNPTNPPVFPKAAIRDDFARILAAYQAPQPARAPAPAAAAAGEG